MKTIRFFTVLILACVLLLLIVPSVYAQSTPESQPDFWSAFLQKALLDFGPFLVVLGIGYLVKVGSEAWERLKATKPDLARSLEWAATLAVHSAEQAGAAALIDDKKNYALDVAKKWLAMRGLKVDLHLVDAAIEAAVFRMKQDQTPALIPGELLSVSTEKAGSVEPTVPVGNGAPVPDNTQAQG